MKIKSFTNFLIILLVGFGIGYLTRGFSFKPIPNTASNLSAAADKIQSPSPSSCFWNNGETTSTESAQPQLSESKVFNDPTAVKIIHNNCLWVFGATKADLEHNGTENLVFWGSTAGCGSCHNQMVYVLSGNQAVFKLGADDPTVEIAKGQDGKDSLFITQPLRKILEGLAGPSWGVRTEYAWDNSSQTLFSLNQSPFNYAQHKVY